MFSIDWTITLGSLLQVSAILAAAIGVFLTMRNDLNLLRYDVVNIKEQQKALNEAFHQLGKILTQVAVQDSRMGMLERAIDELRHGQGFINK